MVMDHIGNYIHEFTRLERSWSDDQVIDHVLQGEKEYFELLIRRHNRQLFRIARAYLPLDTEAEDIMQEAYIKAFEKLHTFQGRSKFSTWLIRILINCALARNQELTREASQMDIDSLIQSQHPPFEEPKLPSEELKRNIRGTMETAIDSLPEKYRLVFVMRIIQNMSSKETADCLNVSIENVKIRLYRAKKLLRARLENVLNVQELFGFYLDRCDRITKVVLDQVL